MKGVGDGQGGPGSGVEAPLVRPGPGRPPRGWCGLAELKLSWAGLGGAGLGGARLAAGKEAGARAGSGAEAQPHKGAGGATGAALSWVGFVKSWSVSRKPSSRPDASEGPDPCPQPPESKPCVLRAHRCPTATTQTSPTPLPLQPPCPRR